MSPASRPGAALALLLAAAAFGSAAPQPSPLETARRLVEEGRIEEALPHLDRARSQNPDDLEALWMLAVARFRLADHAGAARLAAEFAERAPESPTGPLLEGSARSAMGDLDGAGEALAEALRRDPRHPEARRDLAVLLGQQGRREEAVARFEELRAEYPGRAEVLTPLGVLHVQEGRGAEGLAALLAAVQADPASFEAQYHLGALYSTLGQFDPAARSLEAALRLRPGEPGALLQVCLLRSREERLEAAREACARAASAAPQSAEAQFASGDVLHYLQEEAAAEQAYRRAIALDPGHGRALLRLGLLLHEAGRSAEAVPVLTEGVDGAGAPDDPVQRADGLTTLGRALAAASDREDAILRLEAAAALSPTTPEPHLHLGNLLARSDDPDEVGRGRRHLARFAELKQFTDRANELRAAIVANPAAPGPKKALVGHLIGGGAPRLALEESRRLLTLAAAEPVHHRLYAESLAALGERDEARAALAEALDRWPAHPELVEAVGLLDPRQ